MGRKVLRHLGESASTLARSGSRLRLLTLGNDARIRKYVSNGNVVWIVFGLPVVKVKELLIGTELGATCQYFVESPIRKQRKSHTTDCQTSE